MNFKSFIINVNFLLTNDQKNKLVKLFFLMLVGLFFEILGVGLLVPILTILSDGDFFQKYHFIAQFVKLIGNPSKLNLILYFFSFLIFFYFIRSIFLIYIAWQQTKFSGSIYKYLSNYFFNGYMKSSYLFHLENNSAPLIKNIQVEIELFGAVSQTTLIFLSEFFAALGIILILFIIQPLGALVIALFFIVATLIYNKYFKIKLGIWGQSRLYHTEQRSKILTEGFGGIKDIKLYGVENTFINKFNFHSKNFAKIAVKSSTIAQVPRLYLEFLSVLVLSISIVIIFIQSKGNSADILTLFSVFIASAFRILPSVNRMITSIQQIRYLMPLVDKLASEKHKIDFADNNIIENEITDINFTNQIEIKNISFEYPNNSSKVLDNISLVITKGEFVGFIGKSGSGKSTLIDIFMGLLLPNQGQIITNGNNIFSNPVKWRSQIGYVPQNIYLTDDTIINNIAFGIDPSKIDLEKINKTLIDSQLYNFVYSLPMNIYTTVGERGVRLSGGQKQRIGIARALYNQPEILVLDEATSALDNATEKDVMDSVLLLRNKITIIIVAHRLTTVEKCDKIFILEKGKLINN